MTVQCWIPCKDKSLFGVCYQPKKDIKAGAIIIPGFSQPKCDVDYIMSRLARRLEEEGIFVLQMDPRGHGDSPDNLEDVTLDTLREDIDCGIDYLKENLSKKISVYGVSRGLNAAILSENQKLNGIAGISPYCLDPKVIEGVWGNFDSEIVEIFDVYRRNEKDIKAFFDSVGARETNYLGQKISEKVIRQLMNYSSLDSLISWKDKGCWLFYQKDCDKEIERYAFKKNSYLALDKYADNPLPRVAMWQHDVIESIVSFVNSNIE